MYPWKAYKRWEEKRQARYDPNRWERMRAKGEKSFIWQRILLFGGGQILVLTTMDVFRGKFSFLEFVIRLVLFGLVGRWLSMRRWADAEARYQEYQLHHPPLPSRDY